MNSKLRMIVIDDHPLMREGIVASFANYNSQFEIVGSGGTSDEAIELVGTLQPDLLLLDVSIPGGGLEAATIICSDYPKLKVIMLTVSERPSTITSAFAAGARGYILKGVSGDELVRAVVSVSKGNTYVSPELAGKIFSPNSIEAEKQSQAELQLRSLSSRELEILNLLNVGNTNKDIAKQLQIGEKTVKYYLTQIFEKLAVKNRLEAVIFFRNTTKVVDLRMSH
jgi:two-component system, NarL family, nitrate/nitrite response regulator NarL